MFKNYKYHFSLLLSFALVSPVVSVASVAQPSMAEIRTSNKFNLIKADPLKLAMFLADMPKGGDLHNHSAGATYAENLLSYAKNENICIDKQTYAAQLNGVCDPNWQINNLENNPDNYRAVIDAWSMDNYVPNSQTSGEQHFFDTFYKFFPIIGKHAGEVFSEVIARHAAQQGNYLELLITLFDINMGSSQGDPVMQLGSKIGWDPQLNNLRKKLLNAGLPDLIKKATFHLTQAEQTANKLMHCGQTNADPGCQVKVRYQYIVLRENPPEQVFAQLLAGFLITQQDPRFVGVNIVQAEDGPIARRDYHLHMQMIQFLHQLYPQVHIALHAGELSPDSVPPEDLRFHIRDAIETAHAERIGHGIDIAHETNAQQLLTEMAAKPVVVEVNLTSNLKILGIEGKQHPFSLYLHNHVPMVISTDDEGITRTDITREYVHAVTTYSISYSTLKQLVRNSLTYSFLPGNSLWKDAATAAPVAACQNISLGNAKPNTECQKFLNSSEKARQQWLLEKQFNLFEEKFV